MSLKIVFIVLVVVNSEGPNEMQLSCKTNLLGVSRLFWGESGTYLVTISIVKCMFELYLRYA